MKLSFVPVSIFSAVFLFSGEIIAQNEMVKIPSGLYMPFYRQKSAGDAQTISPEKTKIDEFYLDRNEVTNSDFLAFVHTHSNWSRSKVKRIFAEEAYLKQWNSDVRFEPNLSKKPVVNVSWFAAQAYCESKGKSLPTTDQWEYALYDKGRNAKAVRDRILSWYEHKDFEVASTPFVNGFGVQNLVGSEWEWTLDFKDFLLSSGDDKSLFCGNGSQSASNKEDYPTFMRYSFRASLKASFVTNNLGFRCAKENK